MKNDFDPYFALQLFVTFDTAWIECIVFLLTGRFVFRSSLRSTSFELEYIPRCSNTSCNNISVHNFWYA